MNFIFYLFLSLSTVVLMECVAWAVHKYVMHSPIGWLLHRSHHEPHTHTLEKNDWYALIFALPSVGGIVWGVETNSPAILAVGVGVLIYGILYVVFHDIIVHRRIKIHLILENTYLRRIIRAHKIHHKTLGRKDSQAFGFLYALKKYQTDK